MCLYLASLVMQLLNFFKMSFYLFSISAIVICAVMVPLNIYVSLHSAPIFNLSPAPGALTLAYSN